MWTIPTVPNYFLHFPHFTSKSPKILCLFLGFFCIFHISPAKVPKHCFFGILHIPPPKVPQYRLFVLPFVFCAFHISFQECDFLYFPHLLCRFSGSKSPEHFVFACILLRSVSDFPKDPEFRLPKWKMCEFVNFVSEDVFRTSYIHIDTHTQLVYEACKMDLHKLGAVANRWGHAEHATIMSL